VEAASFFTKLFASYETTRSHGCVIDTGSPPRLPGFDLRSRHVEFVVDEVALVLVLVLRFPLPILIPPSINRPITEGT
jgi:hypothetical protein